jgi:hypothetical protein
MGWDVAYIIAVMVLMFGAVIAGLGVWVLIVEWRHRL